MPNLKKMRKSFDEAVRDIWAEWDEYTDDLDMNPFTNIESVPELEEKPGFNYMVGWAEGVAYAMDWPLDRPLGPKEWSPKGRHPK